MLHLLSRFDPFVDYFVVDFALVGRGRCHVTAHRLKLGLHELVQLFVQKFVLPLGHELLDSFFALAAHLSDLLLNRLLTKIQTDFEQIFLVFFRSLNAFSRIFGCLNFGFAHENRLIILERILCLRLAAGGHLLGYRVYLLTDEVEVLL